MQTAFLIYLFYTAASYLALAYAFLSSLSVLSLTLCLSFSPSLSCYNPYSNHLFFSLFLISLYPPLPSIPIPIPIPILVDKGTDCVYRIVKPSFWPTLCNNKNSSKLWTWRKHRYQRRHYPI